LVEQWTHESAGFSGPKFVERARSVYKNNDRRAALKRQINDPLGSRIVEEKWFGGEESGVSSERNEDSATFNAIVG